MKYKKLLTSIGILGAGLMLNLTLTSSNSGVMGAASSGCGTSNCHGNSSSSTTLMITGVPITGYVAGTVYNLTCTITNPDSNLSHGGFDLMFSGGLISNAPAGTMGMGTEIHHTNKKAKSGNTVSWSFSWEAPASNTVTVNLSGNFVDGSQTSLGDKWASASYTWIKAPTTVNDVVSNLFSVYPNPTTGTLRIQGNASVQAVRVVNLFGAEVASSAYQVNNASREVNVSNLATGNYFLTIASDKGTETVAFTKQ